RLIWPILPRNMGDIENRNNLYYPSMGILWGENEWYVTNKPHRDFAIYRAGLFHYVRQPCPINNKTAMRFLFGSSMKSVHRTIVNNETAMQFLGCMLLILPF
ncbi:hypothetical protein, partial [Segatella maculosa]|uniref:hypothetical protein n=1 Tax=Segatella maculosa TaxID=439703 RepID=UPI00249153F2